MTTWHSTPIELPAAALDVKSDAEGVTLGAQSNGTLLVDLNFTDMAALDALIDALINAKHYFLASKEG